MPPSQSQLLLYNGQDGSNGFGLVLASGSARSTPAMLDLLCMSSFFPFFSSSVFTGLLRPFLIYRAAKFYCALSSAAAAICNSQIFGAPDAFKSVGCLACCCQLAALAGLAPTLKEVCQESPLGHGVQWGWSVFCVPAILYQLCAEHKCNTTPLAADLFGIICTQRCHSSGGSYYCFIVRASHVAMGVPLGNLGLSRFLVRQFFLTYASFLKKNFKNDRKNILRLFRIFCCAAVFAVSHAFFRRSVCCRRPPD